MFCFGRFFLYFGPEDRTHSGLSYQIVHLQNTSNLLRCKRAVWHVTRNTRRKIISRKQEEEEEEEETFAPAVHVFARFHIPPKSNNNNNLQQTKQKKITVTSYY